MDIKEKITIDMLTTDSVSILRQKFISIDNQDMQIGSNIRNAYTHSIFGREKIQKILPEKFYDAIISVWGDTPTIDETSLEV